MSRISDNGELDDAGGESGRPDRLLMIRGFKTLALAIHRRFKLLGRRNPSDPQSPLIDQMSPAEWEALIQDEWSRRRSAGE